MTALPYNKYRTGYAIDGFGGKAEQNPLYKYSAVNLQTRRKYETDVCNRDVKNNDSHFPF